MYRIEVKGRYNAVVEVEGRAAALWVIAAAKSRNDVALIRIIRGEQSCTFAFEGGVWIESGQAISQGRV